MSKNERPHYTLNIQSGRHVATQKLVLPKQLPDDAKVEYQRVIAEIKEHGAADGILEDVPGWIAAAKRALGAPAPTDE